METLMEQSIANIVTNDFRTSDVFKKYNIDFCCGGKKQLKDVCVSKNISIDEIVAELNAITETKTGNQDFDSWNLDFLIDYILNVHHAYVKNSIPVITQYAEKVARVHGGNHAELIEIRDIFFMIADELDAHMQKEEMILFPYIKKLVDIKKNTTNFEQPPFSSVNNPIRMMEAEHEVVGDLCHKIDMLTGNYQTPEDACNTYKVLFAKLNEFEQDLHKHVHLENNILFPKAMALELEVISQI